MKYQGKEFKLYLQANSKEELDNMIAQANLYARKIGTGPIRILQESPDPDGGWEAIISAHNLNPIKWIKEKISRKKEPPVPEWYKSSEKGLEELQEEEELQEDLEKEKLRKEEETKLREAVKELAELERQKNKLMMESKIAELEAAKAGAARTEEQARKKWEWEQAKKKREDWERRWKQVYKTYKAILGPMKPVPRNWYIPSQMPEYYVPGERTRRLTAPPTQGSLIAEINRPQLEGLIRASAPPPPVKIKAPSRDIAKEEGIGPALKRLRELGKFPPVDWAVYNEIKANNDIDTPSHIREKVGMLGFSRKEINDSLSRLRKLGLVVPTGLKFNGEPELMIVGGGQDGHR